MGKRTALENYIIFEDHITVVERISQTIVRVYFVGGNCIDLHGDEGNSFWEYWSSETNVG